MPAVPVILDTDMDTDCDDAGALAVLHALAGRGEAAILGAICDAPTARRFTGAGSATWAAVSGVSLYRKLLAEQGDGSVVVIAIGLLTVLANLLESGPDEFSPLVGMDLVRTKAKALVTMGGGTFPEGHDRFNWYMDHQAATHVLNTWPGRLAVNQWGASVLTGARLTTTAPPHNPVRLAYETFLGDPGRSRPSWDQLTVLYAVRGARDVFNETRGYRLEYAPETGSHRWQADDAGPERIHVGLAAGDDALVTMIEDLMVRPPSP